MAELLRIVLIGLGFVVATYMLAAGPSAGHIGPVNEADRRFQERAAWVAVTPPVFDIAPSDSETPPAQSGRR